MPNDATQGTISVLVPAYNEEALIIRCLDSLVAQQPLPDEIVVVDNGSTDRTNSLVRAFIEAHPDIPIKLIYFDAARGCPAAREAGWRHTTGSVIIHVDADEVLPPGWMEAVHQTLARYPDVDAIGGTYRFENAPPIIGLFQFLYNVFYPRVVQLTKGFPYLTGGMTITRREVLEAMNGYAELPADQLEDYYFSMRAHALGYKLRYIPSIYGVHSLRRYESGGLQGFLKWGVSGLDATQYDAAQAEPAAEGHPVQRARP